MKKFKEFYFPIVNKAMAESIISHAKFIGYNFTNSISPNPSRVKFYSNGNFSIVNDSIDVSGEMLCWYKFFTLTPEDVIVEPERFDCTLLVGSIFDKRNVTGKIGKDQIERIKAIMNEGKQ